MFEGDSAETLIGKFPLLSMGCRAEGLACPDPLARTPIGTSRISLLLLTDVVNIPEGVVVGIQIFAWAPN